MPRRTKPTYTCDELATTRSKHWLENNVRNERTAGFPPRLIYGTCLEITSKQRAPTPLPSPRFLCVSGRGRGGSMGFLGSSSDGCVGAAQLTFRPTCNLVFSSGSCLHILRRYSRCFISATQVMWFDNRSCGGIADVDWLRLSQTKMSDHACFIMTKTAFYF